MRLCLSSILAALLLACGGGPKPAPTSPGPTTAPADTDATAPRPEQPSGDGRTFDVKDSDRQSRPTQGKLKATASEAAVRLFVVDKNNAPIKGVAISLTAPDGKKYYTEETDAEGFTEVLLPIGQTYGLIYLSLAKRDVSAKVDVANTPNLNLKLTMRYKSYEPPPAPPPPPAPGAPPAPEPPGLVLDNVEFPTGKATLIGDSESRLDVVVEYMTHKKSVRIEISGHTDDVGDKKANKVLSQKRADAVRDYLVSKGIDRSRIESVGHGDAKPIAPNTTPEGRQRNRRIEARELP